MGYETIVLDQDKDVKQNYDNALTEATLIFGVGHGNTDRFAGYENNLLEVAPTATHKYENKLFGVVSCLVGVELLPDMEVKNDNFAGLGETTEYWFVVGNPYQHDGDEIGEDMFVEAFILSEFAFRKAILEGKQAQDAYQLMLDEYENQARKFDKIDSETAYYLRYDANFRKRFGNPVWQIQPPQQPPQPPPQEKYECPYCQKVFDKLEQLGEHIKDAHKDIICGQQPPPPPPEKHYVCPYCGVEYNNVNDLKQHICTVHFKPCKLAYWFRKKLQCPIVDNCQA